jgi:hypothetical protein
MFQDVFGPRTGKKAFRFNATSGEIEVFVGHGKNKVLETIKLVDLANTPTPKARK